MDQATHNKSVSFLGGLAADILAVEKEAGGLLDGLLKGGAA